MFIHLHCHLFWLVTLYVNLGLDMMPTAQGSIWKIWWCTCFREGKNGIVKRQAKKTLQIEIIWSQTIWSWCTCPPSSPLQFQKYSYTVQISCKCNPMMKVIYGPNVAKYKYAYLSAPNMAKWGVPEKILRNAVQTRWSVSIGPSVKSFDQIKFLANFPRL